MSRNSKRLVLKKPTGGLTAAGRAYFNVTEEGTSPTEKQKSLKEKLAETGRRLLDRAKRSQLKTKQA